MIGSAYIKENRMYLQYVLDDYGRHAGIEYDIGQKLLDFLWFDIENINQVYIDLCAFFTFPFHGSDDEYVDILCKRIDDIDLYCPYLHFYTQAFLKFMSEWMKEKDNAYSDLFAFIQTNPKCYGIENYHEETYQMGKDRMSLPDAIKRRLLDVQIASNEMPLFIAWLKDSNIARRILMKDMRNKRAQLQSGVDQIVDYMKNAKNEDAMQILMTLDSERVKRGEKPYFIGHTFESELLPANIKIPNDGKSIEWNANYSKYGIVQMYKIESVDDLIRFELLNLINKKILIKKCQYCGCYFVPSGRRDTEYCNRVKAGETHTCKEVGAMQKYKAKIAGDKINMIYNKAYKRNDSKARNKKMSKSDFYEWSELARKMRDDCHAGNVSFEDFQAWLNQK